MGVLRMSSKAVAGLFLSIVLVANTTASDDAKRFWPQWRGPTANGVSPSGNPPTEWSETKNVHWKIAMPGAGSSTPVLWGNRLYVTTAVPFGARQTSAAQRQPRRNWGPPPNPDASRRHRFLVLAIDRSTGETVWETSVREELPHAGTHEFGNFATASAMTDGEHVWAFFGSRGLFCLDMEGRILWEKDFGDMRTHMSFGEGASPVLHDEFIVVPWDHNGESFVAALRKITGEQVWKTERDEITSWSTPRVVEYDGVAQVITNATNRVRSYDLATGELLWESSGMTRNVIPTPVEADGIVYVMSGFRGNALQAIRLEDARGDITGSDAILWEMDRDTPYTASPLLYDGTLYFMKRNSHVLSVVDAASGERHYQERLGSLNDVFSSPVGAAGRVYVTGRQGTTVVLEGGSVYKVLATNSLDDEFDASMVVVDREIYLRGKNLYRISE